MNKEEIRKDIYEIDALHEEIAELYSNWIENPFGGYGMVHLEKAEEIRNKKCRIKEILDKYKEI